LSIEVGGTMLPLNLAHRHERRYAAAHVLNLQYPQSDIDKMLFARFVRAGDALLDAGANIGFTALEALSAGCSKVHCFEALPELAARIERLNDPRITLRAVALSDRTGHVEMTVSTAHNQGSTYRPEIVRKFDGVFGDAPELIRVPCSTIDAENLPAFDIWKLDVEGAEVDLIAGAERTLTSFPPRVIIAEVFDPMFDAFEARARRTHPHCYRALIAKRGYELTLAEPGARITASRYHSTSPTYVFLREKLKR
jgi:FkbM family methyltransferase